MGRHPMTLELNQDAQAIVDEAVASGRYASPETAIETGLALLAARDAEKLAWLRNKIQHSIERGGSYSDEEVGEHLDRLLEDAERKRAAK